MVPFYSDAANGLDGGELMRRSRAGAMILASYDGQQRHLLRPGYADGF